MVKFLARIFIKNKGDVIDTDIRQAYGVLCGIIGILLNVLLFAGKFLAGIISGSVAITADAFNNLSDAGSSGITLIGFKIAGKKPDEEHPFGHGRMEYLSGLLISMAILIMGFELAKTSITKILHPEPVEVSILSFLILLVSILVKLYMSYYNAAIGKKIDSAAMRATAADSLSDSVATTVVLLAMLVMEFTGVNVDGISGVLVAGFILFAGWGAAKDTIQPLLGKAPEPDFVQEIIHIVMSHEEIVGTHDLVVHDYGPGRVMISIHAEVPGDGDIFELHDVIDQAERELKEKLGCEAVIHMDPVAVDDDAINELRTRMVSEVKQIDERITIHDFRMVNGPTHTNVIFDAVVPQKLKMSDEEVKHAIEQRIRDLPGNFFGVITIDKPYL